MANLKAEIDKLRELLTENKDAQEVKEFLSEYTKEVPLTSEAVLAYVETTEGQALMQPKYDRRVTQAIKTREEAIAKAIQEGVQAEMLKLNPPKSPRDILLEETLQKVANMEKENEREKLKRQSVEIAAGFGLPVQLAEFPGDSIEERRNYFTTMQDWLGTKVNEKVNGKMIDESHRPGAGNGHPKRLDKSKLDFQQAVAMEESGALDSY